MEDFIKFLLGLFLLLGVLGLTAVVGYIVLPFLERKGWL